MINTVIFDLEDVLTKEMKKETPGLSPLFAYYLDELANRDYRVFIIRRKSIDLLNSVKQSFKDFTNIIIVNHEGLTLGDNPANSKFMDFIKEHDITPAKTFYFWSAEGLKDKKSSEVYDFLSDRGFSQLYGITQEWLARSHTTRRISHDFRFRIFGETALSETISLTKVEQKLAGQLLSLLTQRMCHLANLNPHTDWEYFVDALVYSHCRELGLNDQTLTEEERQKIIKELGDTAVYDQDRQRYARAGALLSHECMSAYEDTVYSLKYWNILKELNPHHYEMKNDASALYNGSSPLLKEGNRKGFTLAVGSFFRVQTQFHWGYGDITAPKDQEITISEEIIESFEMAGLVEQSSKGLVWTMKIEPIFSYFGWDWPPQTQAEADFVYASGKKSLKDRRSPY